MPAPTRVAEQPVVTHAPRRFVVYRRLTVAHQDLKSTLPETFAALYHSVAAAGAEPAGAPFVVYRAGQPGVSWEIDVCAPVASPMTAPAGLEYVELPSDIVVTLLHVGPYDAVAEAYARVEAYVTEHGLQPAGPPREHYYSDASVPPSETRTLIEQPVSEP